MIQRPKIKKRSHIRQDLIKTAVCMTFLKKQLKGRQDMKTIITEVKKKKTNTSQ